ncbi:CD047-like protein, partial [Mya arenaria]
MGERGGKADMDRVGLFQEMGYVTINDRYKGKGSATKGKQVLPGGSKTRSALQAGYFTDKFGRIMEGEAFTDPIKMRRQARLKESQKNIGKSFLPSSGEKLMSGLGSHYGTLSGPISAFSPVSKPGKEKKSSSKNVITNPGKRGTGFGYVAVTIGKYPQYQGDNYDMHKDLNRKEIAAHKNATKGGAFKLNMHPRAYFDGNPYNSDKLAKRSSSATLPSKKDDSKPFKPSSPGKKPGGAKIGTFDPYPKHSDDPYKVKVQRSVNVVNKSGRTFMPSQGPKTRPMVSIINANECKSKQLQICYMFDILDTPIPATFITYAKFAPVFLEEEFPSLACLSVEDVFPLTQPILQLLEGARVPQDVPALGRA